MSRITEKTDPESLRMRAKATLQALLTVQGKAFDASLRKKLRLYTHMAQESGFFLHLADRGTELGELMAKANDRSTSRGWL